MCVCTVCECFIFFFAELKKNLLLENRESGCVCVHPEMKKNKNLLLENRESGCVCVHPKMKKKKKSPFGETARERESVCASGIAKFDFFFFNFYRGRAMNDTIQ